MLLQSKYTHNHPQTKIKAFDMVPPPPSSFKKICVSYSRYRVHINLGPTLVCVGLQFEIMVWLSCLPEFMYLLILPLVRTPALGLHS